MSAISCLPCWNDVTPRVGASYDLFGNGRTAVKALVGKYTNLEGTSIASAANPANAIVATAARTWNDETFPANDPRTGNFFPDCALANPLSNGECGPTAPSAFGTVRVVNRYDPALLEGWGLRGYNWQANVALQHELRPGVGLNVAYFRTWYGNFFATHNQALTPGDFSPYCITTPVDARIPGGGGTPLCGFNDVSPALVGRTDNVITAADTFGDQSLIYNGVEIGVSARFGRGGLLSGGISTGQQVGDTCDIALAHPEVTASTVLGSTAPTQSTEFCRVTLPWAAQTQVKLNGAYPLPWWELKVAGTLQNLPGAVTTTTYAATNAEIVPTLGRNHSSCGAVTTCTATVVLANIIEPNTKRENRVNQVDLRFSRAFTLGRARLTGMFDIYNLFNISTVTAMNTRYGPQWLVPTAFIPGRLFKFGAQLNL